jgi:hypothetical protein
MVNQTFFKTYTNKENRFMIQYPDDWAVRDWDYPFSGGLPDTEVLFDIDGNSDKDKSFTLHPNNFMVNVEEVRSYLDTDTMTLKNTTLEAYCQMLVDAVNKNPSNTLIRQNELTVGGNHGCMVEWTKPGSYDFETFTIVDGKLYRLSYSDYTSRVPETFPLAKKMVESFQFNK